MYKVIVFAVLAKDNKPMADESKFCLAKEASFSYPETGVCIVKAIVNDELNLEKAATGLDIIDYDAKNVDVSEEEKKCQELNAGTYGHGSEIGDL